VAPYIEAWFALSLVIIGLSPRGPRPRPLGPTFFVALKRTGFAPINHRDVHLCPPGLVILLGHNLWVWNWPVFVTIAGWGMTTKATLLPALPRDPQPDDRQTPTGGRRRTSGFRVVGAVMSVPRCGAHVAGVPGTCRL